MGCLFYRPVKSEGGKDTKPAGIYAVIEGRPARRSKEYVQLEIFSSFYCGHCYNFFGQENTLGKKNKIKFVHIPIQWGDGSTKATEAYLIARDMGKGDEMRAKLFEAQFVENQDISDVKWLKKQASSLGLSKKFGEMLDSGVKAKEIADNLEMAHQLSINETPTVIIGGNLIVIPRMTGGNMNVFIMNIDT
ncbi:MAG: DsbA family protein, partial [Nitrospinae bacterium]|nr:DsbA family protein [Nitrospinota bacterium]